MSEWIKNKSQDFKYPDGLKAKDWRRIYHTDINQKKSLIAILISEKADFKKVIKEKEGNYMTKGPILHKNITTLNVYVSSNRTSNYLKEN